MVPIDWEWTHWILRLIKPWWGFIWWALIVILLALGCWCYLFGFGLLSNVTHRIVSINHAYIRETRLIIENEVQPLGCIFDTSLYGAVVRKTMTPLPGYHGNCSCPYCPACR